MLLLDQSTVPEPNRIPTDQLEDRVFPKLPANPCTIIDLLKAGAHLEDVLLPRARHHFHAPIANPGVIPPNPNAGLDNKIDHPSLANVINTSTYIWYRLTFDLTGASALKRASGTEDPNWEVEVKYEMLHQDGPQTLSFPVFFIRDEDGNWRLSNFQRCRK